MNMRQRLKYLKKVCTLLGMMLGGVHLSVLGLLGWGAALVGFEVAWGTGYGARAQEYLVATSEDLIKQATRGGVLYLAAGEYLLHDSVELAPDVTIIGAGEAHTTIASSNAQTLFVLKEGHATLQNVTLESRYKPPSEALHEPYALIELHQGTLALHSSIVRSAHPEIVSLNREAEAESPTDQEAQAADSVPLDIQGINVSGLHIHGQAHAEVRSSTFQYLHHGLIVAEEASAYLLWNHFEDNSRVLLAHGQARVDMVHNALKLARHGLWVREQAQVTLSRNEIQGGQEIALVYQDQSSGVIEHNTLREGRHALKIVDQAALKVEHNTFEGMWGGAVAVVGQAAPQVRHNTIQNTYWHGIYIGEEAQGHYSHNQIQDASGNGVHVVGQAQPLLEANHIISNQNGILFGNSSRGVARDNIIDYHKEAGVVLKGEAAPRLEYNTIKRSAKAGIHYLEKASGISEGNKLMRNTWHGVAVEGAANPMLTRNTISHNLSGIYYIAKDNQGQRGMIESNVIRLNADDGIHLFLKADPIISSNLIRDNEGSGVEVQGQAAPTLTHNTITYNRRDGLHVTMHARVEGSGNTFERNQQDGVSLSGMAVAEVQNSTVRHNGWSGVRLTDETQALISQSVITDNRAHGVIVKQHARAHLTDNRVLNNAQTGLAYYGQTTGLVQLNQLEGNGVGVTTVEQAQPKLIRNTVTGNRFYGLDIGPLSSPSIKNNTLSNNHQQDLLRRSSPRAEARWEWTLTRNITASDQAALSCEDLAYMRRDILALHGSVYEDAATQAYLTAQSWYRPTQGFSSFEQLNKEVKARLNGPARYNLAYIDKMRAERLCQTLPNAETAELLAVSCEGSEVMAEGCGSCPSYVSGEGAYMLRAVALGYYTQTEQLEALVSFYGCDPNPKWAQGTVLLQQQGMRWQFMHHMRGWLLAECLRYPRTDGRDQLLCESEGFAHAHQSQAVWSVTVAERGVEVYKLFESSPETTPSACAREPYTETDLALNPQIGQQFDIILSSMRMNPIEGQACRYEPVWEQPKQHVSRWHFDGEMFVEAPVIGELEPSLASLWLLLRNQFQDGLSSALRSWVGSWQNYPNSTYP